jgi:hypothetical protein
MSLFYDQRVGFYETGVMPWVVDRLRALTNPGHYLGGGRERENNLDTALHTHILQQVNKHMGFCNGLQYWHSMFSNSAESVKYAVLCFVNVANLTLNTSVITAARRRPSHDTPEMNDVLINGNTLQFVKDKHDVF